MASRANMRQRPLDLQKQLPVVRDLGELDPPVDGAKDVVHTVQARDEESKKSKRGKDIPIPMVRELPSYGRDYLPVFRPANTYIRGRGGVGHKDENFVEYDLDREDRAWLEAFNDGQDRLPARRFELLIWKLEMVNAEANDRVSAASGAGIPDRLSPAIVAQIGNLRKEEALQAMSRAHALRQGVLLAVYNYWREKRVKRGRPLLRSLQAPTATSDGNPYNVFRPRDKIHRPQTRRRRENNEESLDKMKQLRQNLVRAYEVLEWLTKREQTKCNVVYLETDYQQHALKLHHEAPEAHEAINQQYTQQASHKGIKRPLHVPAPPKSEFGVPSYSDIIMQRFKRRKKHSKKDRILPISQLQPPPLDAEPEMLFAETPDTDFTAQQVAGLSSQLGSIRLRPRIGRGGRLLFDRCRVVDDSPVGLDASQTAESSQPKPIKLEPGLDAGSHMHPNGIKA